MSNETSWETSERLRKERKNNPKTNSGYYKVFLRIATGLLSKTTQIPESCLRTEFRVPVYKDLQVSAYRDVQEYIEPRTNSPVLVFRWNGQKIGVVPVMDLVDVRA